MLIDCGKYVGLAARDMAFVGLLTVEQPDRWRYENKYRLFLADWNRGSLINRARKVIQRTARKYSIHGHCYCMRHYEHPVPRGSCKSLPSISSRVGRKRRHGLILWNIESAPRRGS